MALYDEGSSVQSSRCALSTMVSFNASMTINFPTFDTPLTAGATPFSAAICCNLASFSILLVDLVFLKSLTAYFSLGYSSILAKNVVPSLPFLPDIVNDFSIAVRFIFIKRANIFLGNKCLYLYCVNSICLRSAIWQEILLYLNNLHPYHHHRI